MDEHPCIPEDAPNFTCLLQQDREIARIKITPHDPSRYAGVDQELPVNKGQGTEIFILRVLPRIDTASRLVEDPAPQNNESKLQEETTTKAERNDASSMKSLRFKDYSRSLYSKLMIPFAFPLCLSNFKQDAKLRNARAVSMFVLKTPWYSGCSSGCSLARRFFKATLSNWHRRNLLI